MATTQPIRNKKQVKELVDYYLNKGQPRNHVLVTMSIHTALRIGDLLRLTWDDLYDFDKGRVRKNITLIEEKTGKTKTIALHKSVVCALTMYAPDAAAPGRAIIANPRTGKAISRVQAYRLIRAASEALEFEEHVSCHSLRKTFGYFAWKAGVLPVMLMDIYNHSSFDITRRYLGIAQDDRDKVYLSMALF